MKPNDMFHIEVLEEIVETVFYTGSIEQEIPVSIIFVGPSGIGKSKMLARYKAPSIHPTDSITSKGLYDIAIGDPKNEIRFVAMPDMNPSLARKPSTVEAAMASLLSFTSDGTVRIDDGRQQKQCKHDPVGIITASTDEIYNRQDKKWFALGLRRRIIPMFYKYGFETLSKLQALTAEDKIHSTPPTPIELKLPKPVRPTLPKHYANLFLALSTQFSVLLGKAEGGMRFDPKNPYGARVHAWYVRTVVPISPQVTLNTLARAHALRARRGTVNEADYQFILKFLSFCDPEFPKEI